MLTCDLHDSTSVGPDPGVPASADINRQDDASGPSRVSALSAGMLSALDTPVRHSLAWAERPSERPSLPQHGLAQRLVVFEIYKGTLRRGPYLEKVGGRVSDSLLRSWCIRVRQQGAREARFPPKDKRIWRKAVPAEQSVFR